VAEAASGTSHAAAEARHVAPSPATTAAVRELVAV
jgi:hypothetical protein